MNNTELFERIKQECLDEIIKDAGYKNFSELEKNAPKQIIIYAFNEACTLAMQKLSEFYRWCGNKCLYNYVVDSWIVVDTIQKKTELELYDIYKEEKGETP